MCSSSSSSSYAWLVLLLLLSFCRSAFTRFLHASLMMHNAAKNELTSVLLLFAFILWFFRFSNLALDSSKGYHEIARRFSWRCLVNRRMAKFGFEFGAAMRAQLKLKGRNSNLGIESRDWFEQWLFEFRRGINSKVPNWSFLRLKNLKIDAMVTRKTSYKKTVTKKIMKISPAILGVIFFE